MPGYFKGTDGDLENTYVTDYAMIDQYAKTGSLWVWGQNGYGALGTNNATQTVSPVQTVSAGTNWSSIAAGASGMAGIKTDGSLWLWGKNNYGQLGNNNTTHYSSPIQTISGGTNWKQIGISMNDSSTYMAALKTDGTLWLWGKNDFYQLGDGTGTRRSSPTQIAGGGNNWKQISAGGQHAGAIKTDGTLWMWGSNHYGQAGINSNSSGGNWQYLPSTPVQTIAGGTNWKQVSCGQQHTAAIKTDGTLWLWGRNLYGELGNGFSSEERRSPVQTISGGTNWKQVSAGFVTSGAIKTDGTLWMWGGNYYGRLGNGTNNNIAQPQQTVALGTNWKYLNLSQYHTAAIKTDGTLWSWGGPATALAVGNYTTRSSPIQTVAGGNNWKTVTGGYGKGAAIYFYDAGNIYQSA